MGSKITKGYTIVMSGLSLFLIFYSGGQLKTGDRCHHPKRPAGLLNKQMEYPHVRTIHTCMYCITLLRTVHVTVAA
ncbi:hypothetical protein BDV39DRAFT_180858 [Aspergillus sergii]|uniref:Uncharacterized protein n=1 Tax=Aspergillus sergii TaxID=1034303 RepID=A0A5N6WTN1_9EURO|nr:hypothetical protein BDV39DRAFT_180858 [Aspergillus sergii]